MQKALGNFRGSVVARMTLHHDEAGGLYDSVTGLLGKRMIKVDMKKLRKQIGPKGDIKAVLKEIVAHYNRAD